MTYLDSIILGIIEGLTEFIPVSSTGHLILASSLLEIPSTDALKTFEIAVQVGAILAVVVLYWRAFLDKRILLRLIAAFIPTALVGYVLYHFIKGVLIGNAHVVLSALFLGGVAILLIEYYVRNKPAAPKQMHELSFIQAGLIGLSQALAVIPGVSRSGATAMGGLLMRIPRATILEFSFLLAVPTMLAATGYDIVKDPSTVSGAHLGPLLLGGAVAFVVALAVIRYALQFVRKHSFVPFALYRIALALFFWLFITV